MNKRTEFIGIDGEGETVDGHHLYTLLCSSDSKQVVMNKKGIPTRSALEFILRLAKTKKKLVGFSFNYDVNKILKDLTPEGLAELQATEKTSIVYDDGTTYLIQVIPKKMFKCTRGFAYAPGKFKKTGSFVVYDVFGFFQSSFVKALEEWKVAPEPVIKRIAAMKDRRDDFANVDDDAIIGYCQEECLLLVKLMEKLAEKLDGVGIRLNKWYGAGAIADAVYQKERVTKFFPKSKALPILHAFFGGRIQTLKLGHFENVHLYDINSAYPSAMARIPAIANAEPIRVYGEPREFDIVRVRWSGVEGNLTPFPFREEDGAIQFPKSGEGYYHAVEFFAARDTIPGTYEVLEVWRMQYLDYLKPFAFIHNYYEYRKSLKAAGDLAHIAVKLALNSLYGKTAQKTIDKEPRYQSYYTAGLITATCRANLLRLASQAPNDVIYFATDGIGSLVPLEAEINKDLGGWDYSHAGILRIYQAGLAYLYMEDSVKTRTRSVSPKAIDWGSFEELWERDGVNVTVKVPDRKFVSFKQASESLPWGEWLEDRTKDVSFWPTKGWPRPTGPHTYDVVPFEKPEKEGLSTVLPRV